MIAASAASAASDPAAKQASIFRCYAVFAAGDTRPRALIFPIIHFSPQPFPAALFEKVAAAVSGQPHLVLETGAISDPLEAVASGGPRLGALPPASAAAVRAAIARLAPGPKPEGFDMVLDAQPLDLLLGLVTANCYQRVLQAGEHRVESDVLALADAAGLRHEFLETGEELAAAVNGASPQDKVDQLLASANRCLANIDDTAAGWAMFARGDSLAAIHEATRLTLGAEGYASLETRDAGIARDVHLRQRLRTLVESGPPGAIVFIGADHAPESFDDGRFEGTALRVRRACD